MARVKLTALISEKYTANRANDPLPTDRPVAVYYRQSTTYQVGNASTYLQTIDMRKYLEQRGWSPHQIIILDDDAGVSGTTTIEQRVGMSKLLNLINNHDIGAVACQDEDRLFRDMTQIQVNIFIDACSQANVLVITPAITYDFRGRAGTFYARQFRFKSEMAAEYLTSYIIGRLYESRKRMMMEGLWTGGALPIGFIVDMRKVLSDGSLNPKWRKYVPFSPYADLIPRYFEIFVENRYFMAATLRQIMQEGPYYPDFDSLEILAQVPEGFRFAKPPSMLRREGKYYPVEGSVRYMFMNAAYLGHWPINRRVVKWDNHMPILSEDLFMDVFNHLSKIDLDGNRNSAYCPAHIGTTKTVEARLLKERPLFEDVMFRYIGSRKHGVGVSWTSHLRDYQYYDSNPPGTYKKWTRSVSSIDSVLVDLVIAKVKRTFNSPDWSSRMADLKGQLRLKRSAIKEEQASLERDLETLVQNMRSVINLELIHSLERSYSDGRQRSLAFKSNIARLDAVIYRRMLFVLTKDTLLSIVQNWQRSSHAKRKKTVSALIRQITVISRALGTLELTVVWCDGAIDRVTVGQKRSKYVPWLETETQQLLEMIAQNCSQLEIASEFPDRRWIKIQQQALSRGVSLQVSPKFVLGKETYHHYLKRIEDRPLSVYTASRQRWTSEEVNVLNDMVSQGRTQLEIAQRFPSRKWRRIQYVITQKLKRTFSVPVTAKLREGETYDMCCFRCGQTANYASTPVFRGRAWSNNEINIIEELISSGTTLMDIARRFPNRTKASIKRILKLKFATVLVPPMDIDFRGYETIGAYCKRTNRIYESTEPIYIKPASDASAFSGPSRLHSEIHPLELVELIGQMDEIETLARMT